MCTFTLQKTPKTVLSLLVTLTSCCDTRFQSLDTIFHKSKLDIVDLNSNHLITAFEITEELR